MPTPTPETKRDDRLVLRVEWFRDGVEHWTAGIRSLGVWTCRHDREDARRYAQAWALTVLSRRIADGDQAPVSAVEFVDVEPQPIAALDSEEP